VQPVISWIDGISQCGCAFIGVLVGGGLILLALNEARTNLAALAAVCLATGSRTMRAGSAFVIHTLVRRLFLTMKARGRFGLKPMGKASIGMEAVLNGLGVLASSAVVILSEDTIKQQVGV
jgi:hypothetical protein